MSVFSRLFGAKNKPDDFDQEIDQPESLPSYGYEESDEPENPLDSILDEDLVETFSNHDHELEDPDQDKMASFSDLGYERPALPSLFKDYEEPALNSETPWCEQECKDYEIETLTSKLFNLNDLIRRHSNEVDVKIIRKVFGRISNSLTKDYEPDINHLDGFDEQIALTNTILRLENTDLQKRLIAACKKNDELIKEVNRRREFMLIAESLYRMNHAVAEMVRPIFESTLSNNPAYRESIESQVLLKNAVRKTLQRSGINTLEDLARLSPDELAKISGIGPVAINKIQELFVSKKLPSMLSVCEGAEHIRKNNFWRDTPRLNFNSWLKTSLGTYEWGLPSILFGKRLSLQVDSKTGHAIAVEVGQQAVRQDLGYPIDRPLTRFNKENNHEQIID